MKVVMITMAGREEFADATAEQVTAATGLPVERFVQPHKRGAGPQNNRWNSKRAVQACIDAGEDMFFIEDDLEVNAGRLQRALASWGKKHLAYLYLTEDTPRVESWYRGSDLEVARWACTQKNMRRTENAYRGIIKTRQVSEGWRHVAQNAHLYGSQAVLVPKDLLGKLMEYIDYRYTYGASVVSENWRPFDGTLLWMAQEEKLQVITYMPHPIQHLQVRVRRTSGRIGAFSATYYLTSDRDHEPVLEPLAEEKGTTHAAGNGEQGAAASPAGGGAGDELAGAEEPAARAPGDPDEGEQPALEPGGDPEGDPGRAEAG